MEALLAWAIVIALGGLVLYWFLPLILAPKDRNGFAMDHTYDPDNPPAFAPGPSQEERIRYSKRN